MTSSIVLVERGPREQGGSGATLRSPLDLPCSDKNDWARWGSRAAEGLQRVPWPLRGWLCWSDCAAREDGKAEPALGRGERTRLRATKPAGFLSKAAVCLVQLGDGFGSQRREVPCSKVGPARVCTTATHSLISDVDKNARPGPEINSADGADARAIQKDTQRVSCAVLGSLVASKGLGGGKAGVDATCGTSGAGMS